MEQLETNYQGNRVRYYIFGGNDLLLNANDVCAILGAKPDIFREKYIDLAEAVSSAILDSNTFGDWLLTKFSSYNQAVSNRPSDLP
ncbi:MAG: hypothetical protein ACJ74J_22380 [Blastocatellia bacterium]